MRHLLTCTFLVLATGLRAEVPNVTADIAPVHALVAQVMQGVGAPGLTIPAGASPHSYAMRPSEARALAAADLVVWVGPALTPWLADPIQTLSGDAMHLRLTDVAGITVLENRSGAAFEGHDHTAEGAEGAEDEHEHEDGMDHDHDPGALDPHLWLDPANAVVWLGAIAETLAEIDPEHGDVYRANAARGQGELEVLQASIAARMAPLHDRPFVVFHDAFHYFEARFDTEARAAVTLSDANAPSAARLADVRQVIADTGAVCIFTEPLFNGGLIAALDGGAALKSAPLDPLGATLTPGPDLYPSLIASIADAFETCLTPE